MLVLPLYVAVVNEIEGEPQLKEENVKWQTTVMAYPRRAHANTLYLLLCQTSRLTISHNCET